MTARTLTAGTPLMRRLYEGAAWLEENKGESLPGEHAWEQAAYNDLLDGTCGGAGTCCSTHAHGNRLPTTPTTRASCSDAHWSPHLPRHVGVVLH